MIWINRPAAPAFLTDPAGKWHKETEEAKAHYKNAAVKAFEFDAYNDPKLKEELKKVFVKCAYCETNYAASSDGDVEHFRPKGKVNEKNPQTPGYYWLANDWDNLFLACQHCNQRRKHILYGDDKLQGYGKLDQFPLDPENKRLPGPAADIKEEEKARLLINPCKDKPEDHFAYEKLQAVIVPLTPMGETSVKVYVLQRPYLVEERKKVLLKLFEQITRVEWALEDMNDNPGSQKHKDKFDFEWNALERFTSDAAPYAGMCRFFATEFLKENGLK